MSDWQSCPVTESLAKNKVGRKNQIPQKEIASAGRFPVVDQGQEFIAGYCDDEDRLINFDLPLVIFGDHTRCFKYVDFPFILGADGTKVLTPARDLYDPKFYYFALRAINLPSRGYNRHFKMLKEKKLPQPPLPEQKKIAHILSMAQRAIEQQERLIQLTTELKKTLMQKLFTEGLRGERQKQTEIGPVPESWDVVRFSDSVSVANGQVDPTAAPFSEMLHVGPENIESGTGRLLNLHTNSKQKIHSGNYHFTSDDVLYSKIRPYLNKVTLPDFEGTCSADMYPLRPKASQFDRSFLFQLLLSNQFNKQAISFQDRTGIPKINRAQLGSILLPKPHEAEQVEITDALSICDKRVEEIQRKLQNLTDLFRTLLNELMTAKIRVNSLDLKNATTNY